MQEHQMPTVEDQHRMESAPKSYKDRATRRAFTPRHRVGIMQAPGTARVRSGIRTGTTPHFRLWMADLKLKSVLQKTSTADLADHTAVGALARSAFALVFVAGIRNVYDLTQADVADLLRINGIGVKKLEAVEAYLLEHNVKPRWTVAV
jgi:hypothetical protein